MLRLRVIRDGRRSIIAKNNSLRVALSLLEFLDPPFRQSFDGLDQGAKAFP